MDGVCQMCFMRGTLIAETGRLVTKEDTINFLRSS